MTEQEAMATRCNLGGSDLTWEGKKKNHSPGVWCHAGADPQRVGGSPSLELLSLRYLVLEVVPHEQVVGVEISRRSFPPACQ